VFLDEVNSSLSLSVAWRGEEERKEATKI
jgi:hypothetical protein